MAKKECARVSIGGQAVMEGVMMRGESSMAIAVRDADGIIRVETKRVTPVKQRNLFLRLPIIRGVYSFIQSFTSGTTTLMRSAEVYGEGEPSKFEKWVAEKLKIDIMSVVITISMILGLALAVGLFMWLPQFIRGLIESLVGENFAFDIWAKNFIEGGLKLAIFVGYVALASLLKDVRRTFMYHGAEHKTISCYESGLELTVENAKKCTRVHDRCGTTFMVFVMVISIIVFAVFESLIGSSLDGILRVVCKIALLPVVAGLSYELLKALAKTDCWVFFPLKVPGLLLQMITTREPEDDMLEVAITAFKKVMEMDADPSIEEVQFVIPEKRKDLTERVYKLLCEKGIEERAEAEWIVSIALNVKRDQVYEETQVSPKDVEKINQMAMERATGRPLWYCIGDTDFYGYTIKVDERVLIPRPETEILVEKAKKYCDENKRVLDMCTGSGAIAIAIKKETNAEVVGVDISQDALNLAKENAILNNAQIEFVKSDLFTALDGQKFDLIISNPPYIKSEDINGLQREVRDFEPMLALDGGEDGLNFYREILKNAKNYLNENGVLIMECGIDQAKEIISLAVDYKDVEIFSDLEGVERIVKVVC